MSKTLKNVQEVVVREKFFGKITDNSKFLRTFAAQKCLIKVNERISQTRLFI